MSVLVVLFVAFTVGFLTGGFFFAISTANNSHDIWLVVRRDGSEQWFTQPEDVQVAAELDGGVRVTRLRVLT